MMKASFWRKAGHSVCVGLLLFILRLAQNLTGFDPDTGLSLPSVPGYILIGCLLAAAAAEVFLQRKLPREKVLFEVQFAAPGKEKFALVLGSMLLVAGGVFLAATAFLQTAGVAKIVTGLLAIAAGGGLLLLSRQMCSGTADSLTPILPALFFSVFLVLAVYLPAADDPVLARYYIQILASAMAAFAFSNLAGFLRQESSPRRFAITANLAVILCLATLADQIGAAIRLLFLGCAVILAVFLLLMRDDIPKNAQVDADAEQK